MFLYDCCNYVDFYQLLRTLLVRVELKNLITICLDRIYFHSPKIIVRCGVRTHALSRVSELKSDALDHSANLTWYTMWRSCVLYSSETFYLGVASRDGRRCGHGSQIPVGVFFIASALSPFVDMKRRYFIPSLRINSWRGRIKPFFIQFFPDTVWCNTACVNIA